MKKPNLIAKHMLRYQGLVELSAELFRLETVFLLDYRLTRLTTWSVFFAKRNHITTCFDHLAVK